VTVMLLVLAALVGAYLKGRYDGAEAARAVARSYFEKKGS
jgi:hypothetical protein